MSNDIQTTSGHICSPEYLDSLPRLVIPDGVRQIVVEACKPPFLIVVGDEPGMIWIPHDDELERLRAWKAEAMTVLAEWEAVWEAAGRPGSLGASKAEAVHEWINRRNLGQAAH